MENETQERSITKTELFEKIENFSSLFKYMGEDLKKWSNLPHSLAGLDLLLKHNLVELKITLENKKVLNAICTSNLPMVKKVCSIDLKSNLEKLKTKDGKNPIQNLPNPKYIVTWNFLRRNFLGISSADWEVKSLLEINETNADILNKIIEKILKNADFQ